MYDHIRILKYMKIQATFLEIFLMEQDFLRFSVAHCTLTTLNINLHCQHFI